jgi:hypothetical protein
MSYLPAVTPSKSQSNKAGCPGLDSETWETTNLNPQNHAVNELSENEQVAS